MNVDFGITNRECCVLVHETRGGAHDLKNLTGILLEFLEIRTPNVQHNRLRAETASAYSLHRLDRNAQSGKPVLHHRAGVFHDVELGKFPRGQIGESDVYRSIRDT